jgi:hypothetical protein
LEHKLVEEMKSNLAEQMSSLKNEFLASREGLKQQLETELRERHAFELAQYRASLMDERAAELEQLTAALKAQSDAELVEVTHELQAQKAAALQAIQTQFEQEREKWLVKLQAAYEVDKQLAEDKLLKQYETEKAVSLTDLRVTLANRKSAALDQLAQRYEQEKALKVRGLNATLNALAVSPSTDPDLARVQATLGTRMHEVDKFTSLAKKIQKLQEENAALKSSGNGAGASHGAKGQTMLIAQQRASLQCWLSTTSAKGLIVCVLCIPSVLLLSSSCCVCVRVVAVSLQLGCRTCDQLLAASHDGALSKQAAARQQLALHKQQHH